MIDIYIFHIVFLILCLTSIISMFFVLSIYFKNIKLQEKNNISRKLPIYIILNYMIMLLFRFIDICNSLINKEKNISVKFCKSIGFFIDFGIINNCFLISAKSYILLITLKNGFHPDLGKYYYKLLLPIFLLTIIYISIFNFDYNYINYFCLHENLYLIYGIPILISYIFCIIYTTFTVKYYI